MGRYVIRRLVQAIPLLIGISLIVFLMIHLAPGDAAEFALGERASQTEIIRLRHYLGLDLPWYQQYFHLMGHWLRGDLGISVLQQRSVFTILWERLPRTAELLGGSILLSLLIALPIGVFSAVRQYSFGDNVVTVISFLGISIPSFWLAILLILFFSVDLHWLPTGGTQTIGRSFSLLDHLKHLILPLAVLTLIRTAGWSRYLRSSMLEVLSLDYVRTARAKGLTGREVLFRHALRNAIMPIITLLGLSLPDMVGGAIITEQIFNWNGLGQLTVTATVRRDIPVVMALVMLSGAVIVLANLLADLWYGVVDPRVTLH
ncbi:MAG TPA: ABC transporter permease [Dehalococcoidia bacterium]|nr:ABC transporter permease [Dehalococcoidia bacterium]